MNLLLIFCVVVAIILQYLVLSDCRQCSSVSERKKKEYFLVAMCHRSKQKVKALANIKSLVKCKRLAVSKKGVAFNFSPRGRNNFRRTTNDSQLNSCMVFSCPEIENSTSLSVDPRFDYYSAYADPIPPINSTCIEGVGVFVIHLSEESYHKSKEKCGNFGAGLPDIASESRTRSLSQILEFYLPRNGLHQAYIGMDDLENNGEFYRSNGQALTCTTFRAWAPGHPGRHPPNKTCCTLDSKRMWRVLDCRLKLPFICEIYPGGWYEDYDFYEHSMACL